MTIKKIVMAQYQDIVNRAARQVSLTKPPQEGWIFTVRKSLNMSGAQLARRLGVTRARVSKAEKAEVSGNLTLKTMQDMAEAMDCRLVFAIVPKEDIETLINKQAQKKAKLIVKRTSNHMALEAQLLSNNQLQYEVDRLAKEMVDKMPSDFWDDKE